MGRSTDAAPSFTLKSIGHTGGCDVVKGAPSGRGSVVKSTSRKDTDIKLNDGQKKLSLQQPSMMDAMVMAPGVQLVERGAKKCGALPGDNRRGQEGMTRKEYE